MITLVGHTKPYKLSANNRIEIFNEFNLLLVNYHLTCLTDLVQDGDTRYLIGWIMIIVTIFGIIVNLLLLGKGQFYSLRLWFLKYNHKKAVAERIEELKT